MSKDLPLRKRSEAVKNDDKKKDTVESLSDELNDKLKPPKPPADPGPMFEHVNRKVQLSDDFERITERVFVKEPLKEYERLEKLLSIGDQRTDYSTLNKHLDEAEENARMAHRLWMTAKIERERYEMDAELVRAAMWAKTTASLQKEKDDGLRNKAITDADVRGMAATLFPDKWREHEIGLVRVKRMEESVGDLASKWSSRCESLRTMLKSLRK